MTKRFVRAAKKLLPNKLARMIGGLIVRARVRKLSRMSTREAFNTIYRRGYWKQGDSYSGPGSEGAWATDYCNLVIEYIRTHGIRTVVDAGCGDFHVGQRLVKEVDSYLGLDISDYVIEQNSTKFGNLQGVKFQQFDIIANPFPETDLLLIRQVLQHLSNDQIEKVLSNIENSQIKRVLIAEQCMNFEDGFAPNIDLLTHSVSTRVSLGSGVDPSRHPFNRGVTVLSRFRPGKENEAEPNSLLVVYEYRLIQS